MSGLLLPPAGIAGGIRWDARTWHGLFGSFMYTSPSSPLLFGRQTEYWIKKLENKKKLLE